MAGSPLRAGACSARVRSRLCRQWRRSGVCQHVHARPL